VLTVEIKREAPTRYIWWKTIGNIYHKYHGPSYTHWYKNGQKYYEAYRVNGELYRESTEGPTIIRWNYDGEKYYESRLLERNE